MDNYEKKYKKAMEVAKKYRDTHIMLTDDVLGEMFSELAESEDERIRKSIIKHFRQGTYYTSFYGFSKDEIIAWLEKQGEQNHIVEEVLTKAGLKPYKDGDQWCILLGDNIQEGICGFGNTVEDALYAFLEELLKEYSGKIDINLSEFDSRLNKLLQQFRTLPKNELINSLNFYLNAVQNYEIYKDEKRGEQKLVGLISLESAAKIFLEELSKTPYNNKPVTDAQIITKELLNFLESSESYNPNAINEQKSTGCPEYCVMSNCSNCPNHPIVVKQKPVDKVKSKFNVGDWVVYCGKPYQITGLHNDIFTLTSCDGSYFFNNVKNTNEPIFYLWTIQDAKDGDVLATLDYILIFEKLLPKDGGVSYCHYDFGAGNPQFIWSEDKNWYFGKEAIIHPATKEQRDFLFQKMKEAGYVWDAEKKELKKIIDEKQIKKNLQDNSFRKMFEQKPAWSEEDEEQVRQIERIINHEGYTQKLQKQIADWFRSLKSRVQSLSKLSWSEEDEKTVHLACEFIRHHSNHIDSIGGIDCSTLIERLKSLKDRVGCEVNCTTTKEWSEEDKEMLNDIIVDVEVLKEQDRTKDGKEIYQKEIDWLKSLKFQNYWKPNEKQIMSLYNSIPNAAFCERETLTQLYVDLKKLTE